MWEIELPTARATQLVEMLKSRHIQGRYKRLENDRVRVSILATKEQRGEAAELVKYIQQLTKKHANND